MQGPTRAFRSPMDVSCPEAPWEDRVLHFAVHHEAWTVDIRGWELGEMKVEEMGMPPARL